MPGAGGAPSGRKLAREAGKRARRALSPLDRLAAVLVDHEAVAGQPDGRLDDRVEGQPAEPLVRLDQSRHGAGHAGGEVRR